MIWQHPMWVALLSAAFGLIESSFSEYWIHRFMHTRGLARRAHAQHHKVGEGQGWAGEFRDYLLPALPFCALGFLPSVAVGVGFASAVTLYFAFAAYAHQLQHERPDLVFWMRAPVHHLHHTGHMTRHNFGIGVDIWDRVFGTHRPESWMARRRPRGLGAWLRIKWL